MKKIASFFILLFISVSCISTKSTLKNIDNDAVRPTIANGMFKFTECASESNYGIDSDYPVNIGIISDLAEDVFIRYFFNGLQGPKGEKIEFEKLESCCPFPTKHSTMGAGLLNVYEVNFEGSKNKQTFYFNIYEKGKIACPKGFQIKKAE
jgi:hypothetical protein